MKYWGRRNRDGFGTQNTAQRTQAGVASCARLPDKGAHGVVRLSEPGKLESK